MKQETERIRGITNFSTFVCLGVQGFVKKVTKEGDGPLAKGNVKVHYTGWLLDGSQFDSSRGGSPFSFPLGKRQVITGWDKGVATMKVGERAVFVLSPEYGYGAEGAPPDIPGNSVLVFDVEVLSCN